MERFFNYAPSIEAFADQIRNIGQNPNGFLNQAQGQFNNQAALDDIITNFQEIRTKIDSGGSFKKTKIKLSEDKRFLFSFALASKGLERVPEYYNAEIAKDFPKRFNSSGMSASDPTMVAGVVDSNLVQSLELAESKRFFYINLFSKDYELRQQQKGTAKMLELNPKAVLKQGEDGMWYADPTNFGDFSLSFKSTFKKSYLEMPKAGGNAKAVDLYIPLDWYNSEADIRITSAIPLLLANDYFTRARIKVRLNVIRPIYTGCRRGQRGRTNTCVSIGAIQIKDYNESIDWNKIGNLRANYGFMSDYTSMNALILQNKYNYYYINNSASQLLYDMEEDYQREFARFKNYLYQEFEAGRIKTKLAPKPLMITFSTSGLLSETFDSDVSAYNWSQRNDPANQQNLNLQVRNTFENIRSNFNEILDTVDFYYNAKVREVVSRVYKRILSDRNDDEQVAKREVKQYFLGILGKMYRDYVPPYSTNPSEYGSTNEEIDKSKKEYNTKLAQLTQVFQSLGI